MKTQLAIQESQLQSLMESPLKVLQGDQDPPVVRARYSVAQRYNYGYGLPTPPGGVPDGWSLAAAQFTWTTFFDSALTLPIDSAGRYAADKTALFNYAWSTDWAVPPLGIYYNDFPPATLPPPNGSPITYTPRSEGGGPYPFNAFNAAYSGYLLDSNGRNSYTIWRGQLRYDGLVNADNPLPYWIARFQRSLETQPTPDFSHRYTMVESGFITSQDSTGYVCRECPYTTGPGAPPQDELFGSAIYEDYYLLGFGQPPAMGDTFL